MIIADVLHNEPIVGDAVLIECGDTLFETVITELTEDGVVVQLDEGIFDKIKSLIPNAQSVDDMIAKKTLRSLGYLIGIANIRDETGTGLQILAQALNNDQMSTFYRAVEIAHTTDPVKRDPELIKGIESAQKDATETDESHILGLVKVAFSHLKNGMNYLETPSQNNPPEPQQDFRPTTKYGDLDEAEYRGRKVPLGKPMKGDVKKSKVYVKKPNGTVVKVNFGDKNMRIKKSNPKRRKSFRARHNCANPGPRWKARYWSCRAW